MRTNKLIMAKINKIVSYRACNKKELKLYQSMGISILYESKKLKKLKNKWVLKDLESWNESLDKNIWYEVIKQNEIAIWWEKIYTRVLKSTYNFNVWSNNRNCLTKSI
jgi:hypothetical protein